VLGASITASAIDAEDLTRLRWVEKFQKGRLNLGMRIAQVAPLYGSVPPKYYGGTERVVSYLPEDSEAA
jgi:hypothetical protein